MNLCFDIGNTKVGLALFSGGKLIRQARLEHGRTLTHEGFFSYLEKVIGVRSIKKAAIVSVVPEMTRTVSGVVRELLGINPLVIHSRLLPGFRLSYRRPEQLGADRMMNGYAAWKLYGGPAVVVDIGTAVTWDAVDAKGVFRGGAIAPGPGLMLHALAQRTAQLPDVQLRKAPPAVGRDTAECIRSGVYWGTAGMVADTARRIAKELKGNPKLILTGGLGPLFAPALPGYRSDPLLLLKGVNEVLLGIEIRERTK
ncbi:MAG TPA: type III pantothenate kinase [Candidatus Edwardsbacteria bacterium]|nr:type III pantothenate kinase [Candidatus Edwardsbacteria bacterium]